MSKKLKLDAKPLSIKQANDYIEQHHRHHKRVTGHRFTIAAVLGGEIVGVVVVGRPVARAVDQYSVAEVSRLCVRDGFSDKHVCSFLYARASRAAEAMGFDRIQTYTLESESGASLRAVAWDRDWETEY